MFHSFGCVTGHLGALSCGGAVVAPHDVFEPRSCLRAIAAERCTAIYGVPTMFSTLLQHPQLGIVDLGSLRTGIIAGARCEPSLVASVVETMHLHELTIGYGLTEMSPVLRSRSADPIERWADATGTVEPHVECKIVDPQTGRTVPVDVAGELCARGYSMMRGYWNDAAASRRAIDEHGWLHTGDLATMRRDGYVRIVGRLKDLIIRGGENVQPEGIEQVLRQHPDVADAQVVGVADADYGEEICAWIRWRSGSRGTPDSIRAFCQGKLADHAIPRHVLTTDVFPTTATGKVRKFELRRVAEAQLASRERRAAAGEPETAIAQEASR
jgi:fatty-acyl-CoA synthase